MGACHLTADTGASGIRLALIFALVLSPFLTSCEISGGSGPSGSWGFPYADFEVNGIVVDEVNQPLGGIRVYTVDTWYGTTYTDVQADGRFSLYGTFTPASQITLTAVDNSDSENWGRYYDATVTVPLDFHEDDYSDRDEWFAGVYTGEVVIMMIKDPASQ